MVNTFTILAAQKNRRGSSSDFWKFGLQTGLEGLSRARWARGEIAAPQALHGSKGVFSFAKENTPFETPRERLDIAGEQLEELQCLPIALPCARRCRVWICYTIWVTSTTRCRSADLVEVRTNFRLLGHSSMRRASAMPHSARSLPPCYRHSRLTIVRRG